MDGQGLRQDRDEGVAPILQLEELLQVASARLREPGLNLQPRSGSLKLLYFIGRAKRHFIARTYQQTLEQLFDIAVEHHRAIANSS